MCERGIETIQDSHFSVPVMQPQASASLCPASVTGRLLAIRASTTASLILAGSNMAFSLLNLAQAVSKSLILFCSWMIDSDQIWLHSSQQAKAWPMRSRDVRIRARTDGDGQASGLTDQRDNVQEDACCSCLNVSTKSPLRRRKQQISMYLSSCGAHDP